METTRHNAIGKCKCGKYHLSKGGGRFVSCSVCNCFIDQERFSGRYVRLGGDMEFIEQICPKNCEHKDTHMQNLVIEDFKELVSYLKDKYKLKIKCIRHGVEHKTIYKYKSCYY